MSVASSFGNLKHRVVAFPSVAGGDAVKVDTEIPITATIVFTSLPILTNAADVGAGQVFSVCINNRDSKYTLVVCNEAGEDLAGVVTIWYTE
jgi:hypothetical protein